MNPEEPRSPGTPPSEPRATGPSASRLARRARARNIRIALGTLLVLGIVGALSARPVWRAIKAQRAMGFAREAESLIQQEKWGPAFEKTRSALQLAPTRPDIVRLAAHLYARVGLEMAFPYFETLFSKNNATRADKEAYITLALGTGYTDLAATQLRALLAETPPSARTFLLASQFHTGLRNLSNAVHYAREAVRIEPGNGTNTLTLARTLLTSKVPADQQEARSLLWPLARHEGPLQNSAISSILSTPDAPRADREEVLAILDAKPKRTVVEELLRQDVNVSLDPSRRTAIADELIESHGRGSIENTAAVAAWLNRQQLYARTLDLVLPDVAAKYPNLVQLRYDALMGLEDFRGAYDFIAKASNPANPLQIEFLRCTTAKRLKDQEATDRHFRNLLEIAAREPRLLRSVADFALRNDRTDIANEAAQQLVRSPRDAASAYGTLLKIADAQGETWAARDYARKLKDLRGQAGDDSLRLQIAYYSLLLEENIDEAFATAEAMHKANPDDFTRRIVLGLAFLRKKQPEKAVELIDHQLVTWAKLPPGIRATAVAILGANHREKASAKLITRVPIARLKPEERALIRPYITGEPTSPTDDAADSESAPEKL